MLRSARSILKVVGPVAVAAVLITACNVTADPFDDLEGLPGSNGDVAYAINEHGIVAGISGSTENPGGEAATWDIATDEVTGLGVLFEGERSEAVDINDAGVAVGLGTVPSFTYERHHAFVAEAGEPLTDINDDLGPFWHTSAATAINNQGIVVGWAVRYLNDEFPTVIASLNFAYDLDTGDVTPLPLVPVDINDNGIVAGSAGGRARSYNMATDVMTDLGTLGGGESHAEALNDSGVVVGQSKTAGGLFHGFLYDPAEGVMTDLGTLGGDFSIANGINDNGDIVGESTTANTGQGISQKPFFYWHANKRMYDLGTIGTVHFLPATDINNGNVVVGYTRETPAIAWYTTVRFEPHD